MIFEAGAEDLLAAVEVLGPDEADDGVDEHGLETAGNGVGAGLAGLLIDAVMGVGGERAALAGLEVHDVVANFTAAELGCSLMGFGQQREVNAEGGVGLLGAGDRLEDEVDRCALLQRGKLGGDVS